MICRCPRCNETYERFNIGDYSEHKCNRSKIKIKSKMLFLGFLTIIFLTSLVYGVQLNIGTKLTTTGNITINIENFTVFADLVTLDNDSIAFYNLTFLHSNACNNTFKGIYNYTTPNINSSTLDWTYTCSKLFYLSICNQSNNVSYINFSFKDQTTLSNINASINISNFNTYPEGFPSLSKSYSYSSSTQNSSFAFCIYPNDYNYYISYNINYGSNGYANGISSSNTSNLYSNITTNNILYLYNNTIPNLVTFQVINSFSQQLDNVYVYVTDYFDINNTIISSGYTDSGGIIQFYLTNSTSYKIYFSKSGYDNYNTILTPTTNFYTITLSGLGIPAVPSDGGGYVGGNPTVPNSKGVTYSTKPGITYLSNGTDYSFNLTINPGSWSFDSWGFNLTDEDNNLISSTSSTNSSGGTLNLDANTNNYTKVIMNFYYTINGNKTNLQRVWMILDLSDNQFSIKHALDDATSYINSGLFGLTTQGLSFIVFFIIFIGAGVLSYKFGLTSPVAIIGFVFVMVWLFDVSLGWIPTPIGAIKNFATILVGIVLFGFIIKEVAQ